MIGTNALTTHDNLFITRNLNFKEKLKSLNSYIKRISLSDDHVPVGTIFFIHVVLDQSCWALCEGELVLGLSILPKCPLSSSDPWLHRPDRLPPGPSLLACRSVPRKLKFVAGWVLCWWRSCQPSACGWRCTGPRRWCLPQIQTSFEFRSF